MRVLHVIPAVAPRYGGPSTAIWPLVAGLNELPDVRAEIATTDADGAGGRLSASELPQSGNQGDSSIFPRGLGKIGTVPEVHLFRRTWSEQWKVSLGLRRWLRRHAGDYDLVHIHAVWSFATAAAARAAERAGVPYIVRPAGMLSPYSWNHRGWKKRLYWRLVERRTIQRAAGFHVTSEQEAEDVRAVRPDARMFVIPNGVDEAAFACTRQRDEGGGQAHFAARTSQNEPDPFGKMGTVPTVLFLSRLHPKKGVTELLLPAMSLMKAQACLCIAGGEDDHAPGYERHIRIATALHKLQDQVVLMGPVQGDERWTMYDEADVFVLPSHSENFGIVVAEAMARGCPVVVTDAVQSSEHVRAAGAGEVVPRDAEALARALDRVLAEPEVRQGYGEAGRRYAAQHFRWGTIAEQVREMYVEVAGGRGQGAGDKSSRRGAEARSEE